MADREYLTTQVYDVSIGGTVYHVSAKVGSESDHSGDITIGGYLTVNGADLSGTAITTTNGGIIVNGPLELTNDGANNGALTVADDADIAGGLDVDGSITLNSTAGVYHGTGSPEGVQVAAVGSLFLRTNGGSGTTLYVKESGSGNTGWTAMVSQGFSLTQSWEMPLSATAATSYTSGFYRFATSASTLASPVTFGTANGAYGAHAMLVATSGATDTEITVSGTSITDAGVRTTTDTEVLSLTDAAANTYYETDKKWIGQVTFEKTAGTNRSCNYGFCKYWDNQNMDFTIVGGEALWKAGATDAGFDIVVYHHKATGWTYNAGAAPTPPTPIFQLSTDYVTERSAIAGHHGAWKRTGASQAISGSGSEGVIVAVVTTAPNALDSGTITMNYTSG